MHRSAVVQCFEQVYQLDTALTNKVIIIIIIIITSQLCFHRCDLAVF